MSDNSSSTLARHGGTFVGGYSIPIRLRNQNRNYDCWAACAGMILDWQGFVVSHTAILAKGAALFNLIGQDAPLTTAELAMVIKKLSNNQIKFERVESPKTKGADFWMMHINQHKPIITSMNNHARIIMGYNGVGEFAFLDPRPNETGPVLGNLPYLRQHLMDAFVML